MSTELAKNYRQKTQKDCVSLPYARVLVVDDVLTSLHIIKGMMKPHNMEVDCVSSGKEAVDAVREEKVRYNAIFMDYMMPEMNGIEATRIIREEIGTNYAKTVPIIALTAIEYMNNEGIFLGNGFQALLSKPIEIPRLDAVLRQWVQDEELEKSFSGINKGESINPQDRRSGEERRKVYDRRIFREKIEGINLTKGLERFSGDRETFREILQSFTINTKTILVKMKEVNKDNLAGYIVNVHGVKSSCRGICAEVMGDQAAALEKAAETGDIDFITTNNQSFINDVLTLITNIETALTNSRRESVKTTKIKKDKPYREILSKLKIACDNNQTEEIDAVMKEIEYFEYTDDNGLVRWLRENTDQMNYTAIAERIAELSG
jgi:CheY-like chemotaxis protein